MNFVGYVPMRRGLLEHTMTGELSLQEFAAFTVLVMLADKSTGAGRINAPVLRTYLPDLSYPATKRLLQSLEDKRYIFRQIVPNSKVVYRYWVNRYQPTSGPHKLFQISLSKVFETKDPKDIEYVNRVPEGEPHTEPETEPHSEPHTGPNNKKEKDKEKEKKKPTGTKVTSTPASPVASVMAATVASTEGSACAPGGFSNGFDDGITPDASVTPRGPLPFGITFRDGRYHGKCGELSEAAVKNFNLR